MHARKGKVICAPSASSFALSESVTAGRPEIPDQTRTSTTMTPESRPPLHSLRTSTTHLSVSQTPHGLPTPVSPDPFHFDKASPVPTPTPKAISVSSQQIAHYRNAPSRPHDHSAPLARSSDWHQDVQASSTVAESFNEYKPNRPVSLRRGSSLQRLHLDAAKERDVSLISPGQ